MHCSSLGGYGSITVDASSNVVFMHPKVRRTTKVIAERVAQMIFDTLMNTNGRGLVGRMKLRALQKARQILIGRTDPLVRYAIGGSQIWIPISHQLPFYRSMLPSYGSNVARIAACAKQKYPKLTFIDIGANVGDTLAMVRSMCSCPVLCIEGDDRFFPILEVNASRWGNSIVLVKAYVGGGGTIQATIKAIGGTATVVPTVDEGKSVTFQTLTQIITVHPQFADAKMMKIDTDGFDCSIIKSESGFLKRVRPIVFFEYDPFHFRRICDDGFEVFNVLRTCGYNDALIYENTGDYMMSLTIGDTSLLEDIHQFYSGRSGDRYCDICVLHADDHGLAQAIRSQEIEFFSRRASRQQPSS